MLYFCIQPLYELNGPKIISLQVERITCSLDRPKKVPLIVLKYCNALRVIALSNLVTSLHVIYKDLFFELK